MPTRRDKWIAGPLPRRAGPGRGSSAKPSPRLLQRLARANKKQLVGRPLAAALRSEAGLREEKRPALAILGLVCLALGVGMLAVGAALAEGWLLAAGAIAAPVGATFFLRRRATSTGQPASVSRLQRDADGLDAYLEAISPSLPQQALAPLALVKETLAKVLSALSDVDQKTTDVPAEELFLAQEMMSRYLPDACRHYLSAANAATGTAVPGQEDVAAGSLCRQLDILQGRLHKTLTMLAASKAEQLANHEAFIRTKQ